MSFGKHLLSITFSLLTANVFGANASIKHSEDSATPAAAAAMIASRVTFEPSLEPTAPASAAAGTIVIDGTNHKDVATFLSSPLDAKASVRVLIARDLSMLHKRKVLASILEMSSITQLRLASCKLTDENIHSIVDRFPHLTELGLHDNALTSKSLIALRKLENIKVLDLSNNYFDAEVATLHKHPSLEVLNLSYNSNIMREIEAFLRPECNLKSLQLVACGITNPSLQTRIKAKFADCAFIDEHEVRPYPESRPRLDAPAAVTAAARAAVTHEDDSWGSYRDHMGGDSDEDYGVSSHVLTDAEATARYGSGYYGYCMDAAHLEYMNRTWNS